MRTIQNIIILIISLVLLSQFAFAGRYYDSRTGRFLQIDPKAFKGPSISPYSYAFNNPLKFIDPDGKWPSYIHNSILETAFKGVLTPNQIKVLEGASAKVDEDQSQGGSYKHAMSASGQDPKDAESKMNEFITEKTDEFVSGEGDAALEALGEALHPVMDATSPSHEGFQVWNGTGGLTNLAKAASHTAQEATIFTSRFNQTVKAVRQIYLNAQKKKEEQEKKKEEQKKEENKQEEKKKKDDQK